MERSLISKVEGTTQLGQGIALKIHPEVVSNASGCIGAYRCTEMYKNVVSL